MKKPEVVIIEGYSDEAFYQAIMSLLKVISPEGACSHTIKATLEALTHQLNCMPDEAVREYLELSRQGLNMYEAVRFQKKDSKNLN